MHRLSLVLLVCVAAAVLLGAVWITVGNIEPPVTTVEKIIPDARFPR